MGHPQAPAGGRWRTATLLPATVVASLAVAVCLAELGAKVFERFHCINQSGGFWVYDRHVGWRNRPGAGGYMQGCKNGEVEFRALIRINKHGLRGPETSYARSSDTFRILLLGDSFTFGGQVEEGENIAPLLAREIERLRPQRHTEVLNASVDAWSTDNALLFYEREGWRYCADLVLLAFDTTNDVFENARPLVSSAPPPSFTPDKPYFELEDGDLTLRNYPLPPENPLVSMLRTTASALIRRSAFARLVIDTWVPSVLLFPAAPRHPRAADAIPFETLLAEYPPHWDEAWRITEALLVKLRDTVEHHGSRFAVAVINAREEVSPRHLNWGRYVYIEWAHRLGFDRERTAVDVDKPNRIVTGILARHRIAAIPTLEAFRAHSRNHHTPSFFEWDIHWTPAGHALAARIIAAGLADLGLLDKPFRSPDSCRDVIR